jgi:HAD superfamily hydrolase (TIGR01549 family)
MLWQLIRAGAVHPLATWRESRVVHHYRRALEYLRSCPEPLAAEQLRLTCDWSGVSQDRASKVIAYWMEESPLSILRRSLRPGLVDFLQSAKARGIRLGLLSDYPAANKLAAMGLDGYFSVVMSAQDAPIGVFKPSPKGLIALLKELDLEPEKAIYIGDRSAVDGEAARRAGVAGVILGEPLGRSGNGWIGVRDIPALRTLLTI